MKKIAILVIAAQNQPVYQHYLRAFWTHYINHTNEHQPQIDVFLLLQKDSDLKPYYHLSDNVIIDETSDFNGFFDADKGHRVIPGILSKTIYALELLQDKYDLFFRTNLSSMIHTKNFLNLIRSKDRIIYSGQYIWTDALRNDLVVRGRVGPDKSIKTIQELVNYPGNSFISGCAYFLSQIEVKYLITNKHLIRYDIIDDVSIGLMMKEHEYIPNFTLKLLKEYKIDDMILKLKKENYCHVRLQHFPSDVASLLWERLLEYQFWT